MKIDLDETDLAHLKVIRQYFGKHDKTPVEHMAFGVIDEIIKKIQAQIPSLDNLGNIIKK